MREVKIIIIISVIACLAAPVLLYLGLNYYRDRKYSYITKDVDNLNQIRDIVGRGITKKNRAILDSVCIDGLSEKILDAIYKQKEFSHPRIDEYEGGWGFFRDQKKQLIRFVDFTLKDKTNDTVYTISIMLFPSQEYKILPKIETFSMEIWKEESKMRFENSIDQYKNKFNRNIDVVIHKFERGMRQNNITVLDSICPEDMSEKILDKIYEHKGIIWAQAPDSIIYNSRGEGEYRQWETSFLMRNKEGETFTTYRINLYLKKESGRFILKTFEMWKNIDKGRLL